MRDTMLAVGGELDATMYGPGTLDRMMKRRAIYFTVKRSQLIPMMSQFDAPDSLVGIEVAAGDDGGGPGAAADEQRPGAELRRGPGEATPGRRPEKPLADAVRSGYTIALGRAPTEQETADSVQFIKEQAEAYQKDGKADAERLGLTDFCQVLMELNEFIYVD